MIYSDEDWPMKKTGRAAFTLIELLVVVGVIAVLIAILVPSLGTAKRVARTAVCGTNLRAIAQSMIVYSTEWDGAIMGNAHTSSSLLFASDFSAHATGISESNVPEVISVNDWLTPASRMMGISFNNGPKMQDRIDRFMQFNAYKAFICPENDLTATAYSDGPQFPVHRVISYLTSIACQYTQGPIVTQGGRNIVQDNQVTVNSSWTINIGSYRPKVQNVGLQAEKAFMADGARYFGGSGSLTLDTNAAIDDTSPGGMSGDWGPWDASTRSYIYNGGTNGDGRTASMRHGNRRPGAGFQSFKFNLSFFDGHVQTMKGLDGADPSLWCPKGTVIGNGECISNSDFVLRYGRTPPVR
jgi:prepilin-type N-terminal cleavage/methylation domain-containing protein/prepilin-type processing-associated H-X9-DG protein